MEKPSSDTNTYWAADWSKWLNVANLLTIFRALMAPVVIAILLLEPSLPHGIEYNILAGAIFVLAALTDRVDGYYARKSNSETQLGAFLDPLADKILIIPLLFVFSYLHWLWLWVAIVVTAREVTISVIRLVGVKRNISFPARWTGKLKMFFQVITTAVLIFLATPIENTGLIVKALVLLMVAITIYSWIDYLYRARREIFSLHRNAR